MKVILLQELKGKGGEGDVIDVADGFANNYLFREGIAIRATKGNLKQLEQRRHNIAKREEDRIADANKMKDALDGTVVKIIVQVGEEGQLFGSVTTQMIAEEIEKSTGIELDRRRIELGKPIKTVGEHEVSYSIYRTIKTTFKVIVAASEEDFAQRAQVASAAAAVEASEKTAETPAQAPAEQAAEASAVAPAENAAEASAEAPAEASDNESAEASANEESA